MPDPDSMRETNLPVARELEEMMLIRNDLANSVASLRIWSRSYSSRQQDTEEKTATEDSLFRDGITNFVGCFDSKNAFPLVVESVYQDISGIAPYFRWLRGLRNSYTAHRHGSARQCSVGVLINPITGEFLGIGHLFARYRGPSQEGHQPLIALVEMAIRYTDSVIQALRQELENQVKLISRDELLKLPPAAVQAQSPENMTKSRGDVKRAISREHAQSDETAPKPRASPESGRNQG